MVSSVGYKNKCVLGIVVFSSHVPGVAWENS